MPTPVSPSASLNLTPASSRAVATLSLHQTSARMTAPPPGRAFTDALSRSGRALLETAVGATAHLPGGPVLSAALRGATSAALAPAAGPLGTAEAPGAGGGAGSVGAGLDGAASGGPAGGEEMLARGQEMSLRMLRLQEAVSEENRRYTALSNVLHARHEMAKNAIGNIR